MLCPLCKVEMRIAATETQVTGDDSPSEPTRVYTVQQFVCRNPQCGNFGQTVKTVRTLIYGTPAR